MFQNIGILLARVLCILGLQVPNNPRSGCRDNEESLSWKSLDDSLFPGKILDELSHCQWEGGSPYARGSCTPR